MKNSITENILYSHVITAVAALINATDNLSSDMHKQTQKIPQLILRKLFLEKQASNYVFDFITTHEIQGTTRSGTEEKSTEETPKEAQSAGVPEKKYTILVQTLERKINDSSIIKYRGIKHQITRNHESSCSIHFYLLSRNWSDPGNTVTNS